MLNERRYGILTVAVVLIVCVLGGAAYYVHYQSGAQGARDAALAFAAKLKNVPLSGTADTAKEAVSENYAGLVTPELLDAWLADPSQAPGRLTSSPWPERLDVKSVTRQGAGYIVSGDIIMMTSNEAAGGGNAGTVPVVIQLIQKDGRWLVAAYQEQVQQE